jgi:hypothetical protein
MNCNSLYFDGYELDGRCPIGGEHQRTGFALNYVLPANVGEPAGHQDAWRFCGDCYVLFFNGHPFFKGTCPLSSRVDGGHSAIGWNFAIPVSSYNT